MRDLEQALYAHELIVLRVIGEWWEVDLTGLQKPACVKALSEVLSGLDMELEANFLGPEEAEALGDLVEAGGRLSVQSYERRHGTVRQMGPAWLEREEPWLDPVSPAEGLWYRGFLYRTFDESDESQVVEYYYLPNELFGKFRQTRQVTASKGESAQAGLTPAKAPAEFEAAATDAADDLTTLLAAAVNRPVREADLAWLAPYLINPDVERLSLLLTLAWELNLLRLTDDGARPSRHVIDWLKKSREAQLRDLAETWSHSAWNDLFHTPGIICEGSGWQNDPILARTSLLDVLPREANWYRLEDLVTLIKENDPDFQRPDGNYDTWYIRDRSSGDYLAGFDSWEHVEGRVLRFIINWPMRLLGLVETAQPVLDQGRLFRLTDRALDWLHNRPPSSEEISVPIVVQDDATVKVPFNANRYQRFQVARVAEASPVEKDQPFHYRLTPASLAQAKEQGIDPERLLKFLGEASGRPIPAGTRRAIERWADKGTEARLEHVVLLRVREAEILDKLRANPTTRKYIGESMGDLAVIVPTESWPLLRQAAARLGLFLEVDT